MAHYYLDIETTGFNPKEDKIVSIQYQELDWDGKPKGELVILKEWESSEESIVKEFHRIFIKDNVWEFIPFLTNHIFDLTFLFEKFNKYKLSHPELSDFLYTKPFIDLKYTLIMANKLSFRGSGLDQMTNKESSGKNIPSWYENKDFKKIEDYIKQETESFLEFLQKLIKELPKLVK